MFGVLLSGLVLLIISAVIPAFAKDTSDYGSKLEEYITSHNPKSTYDVEKLTKEYEEKQSRGFM